MTDAAEFPLDQPTSDLTPLVQPILSCKSCRKRKAGCDKQLPGCSRCASIGQPCEYENVPKRKRKSPTGPKHSGTIEERLASIEACLQNSGMLPQGSSSLTGMGSNAVSRSAAHGYDGSVPSNLGPIQLSSSDALEANIQDKIVAHVSETRSLEPVEGGPNGFDNIYSYQGTATNQMHEPHPYWPRIEERLGGPLADLLFPRGVYCVTRLGEPVLDFRSPQGLRWLSEKTTPNCAREIVQTLVSCTSCDARSAGILSNMNANPPVAMPPEGETLIILNAYFKYCNITHPLFEEVSFRSLIHEQFHGRPSRSTAWYASFNVALCLGTRVLDAMGLRGTDMVKDRRPSDYFENAMRHSAELLMNTPSILGAGALIGLAIYLQTTESIDPSFSFLSITLRQVRQLYLTTKNLPAISAKLRDCRQIRRLFWLAYSVNNE